MLAVAALPLFSAQHPVLAVIVLANGVGRFRSDRGQLREGAVLMERVLSSSGGQAAGFCRLFGR